MADIVVDRRRGARRARWLAEVGWKYPLALVVIFLATFPLLYVVSVAVAQNSTLTGSTRLFGSFSTANFVALGETSFWTWCLNTIIIGSATAVGSVLMGAAAAYAFSRFQFRGRRFALTSLLIVQMFPQMLAFVAIYLLLLTIGDVIPALGINSKLALIAVYLGGALGSNTFLMYGFFNTIPKSLDEAAKIDGATHSQIYWGIILRLVTPILAVVGLLSFIGTFGDFILARIILTQESSWTLAVGMYQWVASELNANWGLFTAGSVIASLPILILFFALQKYIVGGLTAGSVKG
ncbi:sugar ABC transporter permease [Pseudactinotalea terrae]|uniref:sugar ABC transporter permease n=1 Tax=Pseudactinotalea terrae TaxID=1743262 RepID=UPI0012E13CB8|nr:sugar ABC transporter permease [Pseudactinotalea terrae]